MKNYIIGIAGNKNSGKDTVASMINYIFAVGITKANYAEWITRKVSFNNTHKDRIIHFADNLKDVLSIIYNIPREYFDNREFKDELWYCINTGKFVEKNKTSNGQFICLKDIETFGYNYCLERWPNRFTYVKLRTIMQYFGTNICRKYLTDDIWIKSAITKIIDKAESRRICIVPDIRYENEANAIMIRNDSLYGDLIMVKRNNNDNNDNNDNNEHSSELIDFPVNYIINNDNNTLMSLFYKVLEYCQIIQSI